jgi:hypothetical protein
MSDEIRDVTTITFTGPRFDDAGLELDVLSKLLADRKLLVAADSYDDAAPSLWQSIVDLGATVPLEDWDRLPCDLAGNLDQYLYGSAGEEE